MGVGNLEILHRGTQLGVGNLKFCNIVGPNWELGIWEFIARTNIVGGHLGKQKHCISTFQIVMVSQEKEVVWLLIVLATAAAHCDSWQGCIRILGLAQLS